jgi:two-component response regulator
MWKVMIADDEMYMLEALEKLINWNNLDCRLIYKANNGEELIEKIKEEIPDIVITDIKMPLVSGMEVAKYVYEHLLPTKVIILTAYADFEYAKEAIDYDVCGYIVKTSAIEELPAMLRKAITKLSQPNVPEEEDFPYDIFGKLQKYIEDNYMGKLTLSQIANEVHANGSYLSHLYKAKTGQNLFDAINKMKLKKAKEYLLQGKRVSDIALMVGFEDVSYFSRVFKKYENCSPREYEKNII